MLILQINNLKKYYGDRLILQIEDLKVYSEDRIGIVGLNGAGKSTLLDIVTGKTTAEEGKVKLQGSYSYITQLEEFQKGKEFMSGGEKTKLKIAEAFSENSSILFADEPTANLDINNSKKLYTMINRFKGAIMLVSHDREFLNNCCNSIIEINDGTLKMYKGNYDDFLMQKKAELERQEFEYNQYIKEKDKLQRAVLEVQGRSAYVRKAPKRMGNSEARLHKMGDQRAKASLDRNKKAIETRMLKLEVKDKPKDVEKIKIDLNQCNELYSKILIQGENLSKSFGKKVILKDAGFKIENKSNTAIIGDNGCGKTTLIKMIANTEKVIGISQGLKIGYFSQDFSILDENKTIIDNVMESSIYNENFARNILSRLLFKRGDVYKKVSQLSGGEKVKVSFAKIILSDTNILLLDEPTNYLDVYSMEALEELLGEYNGTIVFVSHDIKFINKLATNLIIFKDKKLINFLGNYEDYLKSNEKQSNKDIEEKIFVLENRISQILSRISVPGKNDDVEQLEKEYMDTLQQLKDLKLSL